MKTSNPPILLSYWYASSVNELWAALTNHDQMVQWYFDNIPAFEPHKGFKTQFTVKNDVKHFTHLWEVTAVVPYHSICYSWQYTEYPGLATVCFKIIAQDKGAKLNLELIVHENFPDLVPEFKRESCIAGWNYFLGEQLTNYLSKEA